MKKKEANVAKAKKKAAAKKPAKKAAAKKPAAKKQAASKPAAKKPVAKKSAKSSPKKVPTSSKTSGSKPGFEPAKKNVVIDWENFLTPLDDRLIIEMASAERKTAGGLFIPDTASNVSGNFKGTVLIAGRGHRDEKGRIRPMDVKSGDTILFAEYAGSKLDLMGKEVRILRESEVLGIVEKK